jgi:hypothetical protein
LKEDDIMRINVMGEKVSDKIVKMYVKELVKAHPEKRISAVDIIVEGDFLKVKCEYEELDCIA